jgi:NADPH2:quinone reductase
MIGWGGMAEQVTTAAQKCTPVPADMPDEQAAAFVFTYGTSYHALKQRAELQKDQTVLILGAAGGVGLAAVEIAKAMGARVIAAASTEKKVSLAKKHGADEVIEYPRGPFKKEDSKLLAKRFKDICGEDGANVIYDAVGGGYAEPALRAIAWEGKYLVVGFPAGIPKIPLNLTLLKGCQIVGVFWGSFCEREPSLNAQNLTDLNSLYAAGKVQPYVSANYSLADGAEGIKALAERRALGKIVVSI